MENISTENMYLIDLSYAPTPADIVYELSTIIEQDSAQNQRVFLKLGNVDLNQSQLLSIKSLINSINSTLVLVASESQQTELAAATLGFLISNNLIEEENEAMAQVQPEAPQYVQMTEHLDEEVVVETESEQEENNEDEPVIDSLEIQTETEIETEPEPEEESECECQSECVCEPDPVEEESTTVEEKEIAQQNEEIQASLDSIFDSENKLESLFGKEQEKFPIAQEANEIELPQEEELTEEDFEIRKLPSKYIKQTVRSGQIVNADGNLIIIGDCHPGSEIHAKGDITVWGALGGIAHAGSDGNKKARIRALQLNAIQIRIGDFFARRPDASNIVYVEKNNAVTPEEARILKENIVILKLNDFSNIVN